jgi:hypothetical protein
MMHSTFRNWTDWRTCRRRFSLFWGRDANAHLITDAKRLCAFRAVCDEIVETPCRDFVQSFLNMALWAKELEIPLRVLGFVKCEPRMIVQSVMRRTLTDLAIEL